MAEQQQQEQEEYPARIFVFYSHNCPSCIKKLGLKSDGITQKTQTNFTKALDLLARQGFEVTRFDIMEETNKARLLAITARGESFLPVIISPFACVENPPIKSIIDLIDAILGYKTLVSEEGHGKAND
jgi:hypothetical protein